VDLDGQEVAAGGERLPEVGDCEAVRGHTAVDVGFVIGIGGQVPGGLHPILAQIGAGDLDAVEPGDKAIVVIDVEYHPDNRSRVGHREGDASENGDDSAGDGGGVVIVAEADAGRALAPGAVVVAGLDPAGGDGGGAGAVAPDLSPADDGLPVGDRLLAVLAVGKDQHPALRPDRDLREEPFAGRSLFVAQSPVGEVHRGVARIIEFEPVRIVALLVGDKGVIGGHRFVDEDVLRGRRAAKQREQEQKERGSMQSGILHDKQILAEE